MKEKYKQEFKELLVKEKISAELYGLSNDFGNLEFTGV